MESVQSAPRLVPLGTQGSIWSKVFHVAPLVLVGTLDDDGVPDVAPKHMAMPLGWQRHYGFVCSPRHATLRNAVARGAFTVSFPRPEQIVDASLAAGARAEDGSKSSLAGLSLFTASEVDAPLVAGCYLYLECRLAQVVEGLGDNVLVIGEIAAAAAAEDLLRVSESDDAELIAGSPLLAFVSPGRFAVVDETFSFPFPVDFRV